MKAITVKQPWAALITHGFKTFLIKNWKTEYRGKIAIHAGKEKACACENTTLWQVISNYIGHTAPVDDWTEIPLYSKDNFDEYLNRLYWEQFPSGAVIGMADIIGCHKIHIKENNPYFILNGTVYQPSIEERFFGKWESGCFAWQLENANKFSIPIPQKGNRRLWEWEHSKEI